MLIIGPDEVHLWLAFSDELHDQKLLAAYEALLTQEEKERGLNFYFAKDRIQYLIARALVRTTLSKYANIKPARWRFVQNRYGKPEVANEEVHGKLRFNISHTEGMIICGVAKGHAIGVDVENIHRSGHVLNIAHRYFAPSEILDIEKLPGKKQREDFFRYWTLKEAYIKARGMGLSMPLQKFSIHLADHGQARISFDHDICDSPGQWQLRLMKPTDRHFIALAVHMNAGRPCRLSLMKTVPLRQHEIFTR